MRMVLNNKLSLVFVSAFIFSLSLILVVSATSIKITVDSTYANENWIQLKVSPANTVSSITLKAKGRSYYVPSPSWDHGRGENFVQKMTQKLPYGTAVVADAKLRNGKTVAVKFAWRKGASGVASLSQTPHTPSHPTTHPSSPSTHSSSSSEVTQFENRVKPFRRSAPQPVAHIAPENALRNRNKDALRRACDSLGIKDIKARAFLFAAIGLETETMYNADGSAQRDRSKDGNPMSKNVSPLNMNVDMLRYTGFKGDTDSLNRIENIKDVVLAAIRAINKLGLDGFLNFHRGGRDGYNHPAQYDKKYLISVYKNGLYNIMEKYLQDKSLFNDGRKAWADIKPV